MKQTSRLYQCALCHRQAIVCSQCDRGQIYCSKTCSDKARTQSVKSARTRYRQSFKGKRNHAACQARYRDRLSKIVMDQGSPPLDQCASMDSLNKHPKNTEKEQSPEQLTCCFCKKQVSDWLRSDFLRRRVSKNRAELRASPQAP